MFTHELSTLFVAFREGEPESASHAADRSRGIHGVADQPVAFEARKPHFSERLPEYMVPAAYVWMEACPLSPNEMTGRGALPAPDGHAYASLEYGDGRELAVSDVFEKPELSLLSRHLAAAQLAQFDPSQIQELLSLTRAAEAG